jgi:dolichol-phosphate mannosyltransferase
MAGNLSAFPLYLLFRPAQSTAVPVEISIIVPVFNEADNIRPLTEEIQAGMTQQAGAYELVYVDDASTDETWKAIGQAQTRCPCLRGLRHARNAGQSAALWTGFQATTGPLLATLDGDRQNDPADLPKLLAAIGAADCVCGVRVRRQDTLLRRCSTRIARAARRAVFHVDFQDTGCALRVFKRTVLPEVLPYHGFHRIFPVLVHAAGFRVYEMPVNHRPRQRGLSKYGLWNRLGRGLYDLIGLRWYLQRRLQPVAYSELPEA